MIGRDVSRSLCLVSLLVLAGCAVREPRPQGEWLAEREAWFYQRPEWSVRGRLGLSDGERGGTLSMNWRADGERHEIALRTVAGGKQWRLEMTPGHAVLTGSDIGTLVGPDPDVLVERAVGWPIPVRWMSQWLRGLPAPAGASASFAEDGTLARLRWREWSLEYQRWRRLDDDGVLLPARVEAVDPPYRVRAALTDWRFE
ncbi:MAG: outer membrane lipoprotein LolB [Candidatus Wenzhouxiangella sp. M2_3B_020]